MQIQALQNSDPAAAEPDDDDSDNDDIDELIAVYRRMLTILPSAFPEDKRMEPAT